LPHLKASAQECVDQWVFVVVPDHDPYLGRLGRRCAGVRGDRPGWPRGRQQLGRVLM